jgi:hypothetical protein
MSSLITVLVNVCVLATGACHNEVITSSDTDPTLTIQGCLMGEKEVAQWLNERPQYRIGPEGWKCILGKQDRKDL